MLKRREVIFLAATQIHDNQYELQRERFCSNRRKQKGRPGTKEEEITHSLYGTVSLGVRREWT